MSKDEALELLNQAEKRVARRNKIATSPAHRQACLDKLDGKKKEPRKSMTHPEWHLQVQCVTWFKYQYQKILIGSSLNGVVLTDQQARREKEAGMLVGMPDLQIFAARKGYHGLFVEMKNGKKGVVRETQMDVLTKLREQGYMVAVCRTFEQFQTIVRDYFG